MKKLSDIELPLGGMPAADLLTAGQPTPEDFKALAAAGVKHVVSLRPASEDAGFDEAALSAQLGLSHTVIPVAGPADLTLARAKDLDIALAAAKGEPVLIHCASSNRIGGLLALRAAWLQGKSHEEAISFGRAAGLPSFSIKSRTVRPYRNYAIHGSCSPQSAPCSPGPGRARLRDVLAVEAA